jgi:hypothetical protein
MAPESDLCSCSCGGKIAVLVNSVESIDNQLLRLNRTIQGNGKPGLQTSLAILQHRVTGLEDFERQVVATKRWAALGGIGFLTTLMVDIVLGFYGSK